MDKETVYIETSIVSYLVARPTRDLLINAKQQTTVFWWENKAQDFALYTSKLVLDEAKKGDASAAAKRLNALSGLPLLPISVEAIELADLLLKQHSLPRKAADDALHIAIAALNGINYVLTWNCRHIANAHMRKSIERTCRTAGYEPPALCTPQELGADLTTELPN